MRLFSLGKSSRSRCCCSIGSSHSIDSSHSIRALRILCRQGRVLLLHSTMGRGLHNIYAVHRSYGSCGSCGSCRAGRSDGIDWFHRVIVSIRLGSQWELLGRLLTSHPVASTRYRQHHSNCCRYAPQPGPVRPTDIEHLVDFFPHHLRGRPLIAFHLIFQLLSPLCVHDCGGICSLYCLIIFASRRFALCSCDAELFSLIPSSRAIS